MTKEEAEKQANNVLDSFENMVFDEWTKTLMRIPMDKNSWMDGFYKGYIKAKQEKPNKK